jgi:hypothetical protein
MINRFTDGRPNTLFQAPLGCILHRTKTRSQMGLQCVIGTVCCLVSQFDRYQTRGHLTLLCDNSGQFAFFFPNNRIPAVTRRVF